MLGLEGSEIFERSLSYWRNDCGIINDNIQPLPKLGKSLKDVSHILVILGELNI
jgi:hypothetical protein